MWTVFAIFGYFNTATMLTMSALVCRLTCQIQQEWHLITDVEVEAVPSTAVVLGSSKDRPQNVLDALGMDDNSDMNDEVDDSYSDEN